MELRDGNCFEPIRGIFAGETLLMPQLPEILFIEVPAPEFSLDDAAVARRLAAITNRLGLLRRRRWNMMEDVFALVGSARLPAGGHIKSRLSRAGLKNTFCTLVSEQVVIDDVLGLINSEIFGAGAHRIQLTVFDNNGELIEGGICEIGVIFGSP